MINIDQIIKQEEKEKRMDTPKKASILDSFNYFQTEQTIVDQKKEISNHRLIQVFMKTKKQRMRDIFIKKLKRNLQTNEPCESMGKQNVKGFFGFVVPSIQFSETFTRIVIIINVLVVLILLFLTTLEGFIDNFRDQSNLTIVLVLKIVCLAINLLNFVTKCTNKSFGNGLSIGYTHQILESYALSGRLLLDILTIIMQILTLIYWKNMSIFRVFFFILTIALIFTVSDLIQIETAVFNSQRSLLIWSVIKILIYDIIFAHFLASIILAMSQIDLQNNWMTKINISQENWLIKYVYAFYWGSSIMMTVGFGDVLPSNPKEVIITSFLEMFSCILLGYNISQIGHLIGELRQKSSSTNRKLVLFGRMSKKIRNQLQKSTKNMQQLADLIELQKNIYNHIRQLNNREGSLEYEQQMQLLLELPEHLRRAYFRKANQFIFKSVLFFNRLKVSTLGNISEKIQSKFYYIGEEILQTNHKILILEDGNIGLVYRKKGSLLNGHSFDQVIAKKGTETQLVTSQFLNMFRQMNYNLRADANSIIWNISHEDFLNSLSDSLIDHQYYFSVLHKHPIDQDEWNTVVCSRCSHEKNKIYHSIYNCPKIVYKPHRSILALKSLSQSNSRKFERKIKSRAVNRYSKIHIFLIKDDLIKLSLRLNKFRKIISPLFDTFSENPQNQLDQYKLQLIEEVKYSKEKALKKSIGDVSVDHFMGILDSTLWKFQTKYEEGFWNLETDAAHNYQFYFSHLNANRLVSRELGPLTEQQEYKQSKMSFYGNGQCSILKSENNLQI